MENVKSSAVVGSMLVVGIVWLIKARRLSPSTSLRSSWFLLMPASLQCLLLASSCLGVRINCASFAPVFNKRDVRCRDSGMGGDRRDIGSPRGTKIKATLQTPLLEATQEAVSVSRR